MTNVSDSYDFINKKIITMKENYPSLRKKTDDFAFTALCVKSNFFKNPALDFDDRTIENMMVDGTNDGGIDAMLLDQNSDSNDLILVQSKHYHQISYDDVMDAITKMVRFYESMEAGQYNSVQPKVSSLYQKLCSEVGDESKIVFVLYTTALKKNFNEDKAQKEFKALFSNPDSNYIFILAKILSKKSRIPTQGSQMLNQGKYISINLKIFLNTKMVKLPSSMFLLFPLSPFTAFILKACFPRTFVITLKQAAT